LLKIPPLLGDIIVVIVGKGKKKTPEITKKVKNT